MTEKEKERVLKNIETLLKETFEEGDGINEPALTHKFTPEDDFKMTYLVRSKCFWSIDHLMQYIKKVIEIEKEIEK